MDDLTEMCAFANRHFGSKVQVTMVDNTFPQKFQAATGQLPFDEEGEWLR